MKDRFFKILILTTLTSIIINFAYYFLNFRYPSSDLDLTFIGLIGLLIFVPFLIFNVRSITNCPSVVFFLGLLLYLPMIVIKFDIINLIVILIYINFINYIICNKGRRKIEEGSKN
ncbi:MAG: hypothetical protein ACPLXN_05300 [Sulfurihydrogenibium sp.]|uniref:hypothetical protein n=1 Tax=Sulfurihydrogenibium sp. TaxID=2053621 RepID=UPI003C797732